LVPELREVALLNFLFDGQFNGIPDLAASGKYKITSSFGYGHRLAGYKAVIDVGHFAFQDRIGRHNFLIPHQNTVAGFQVFQSNGLVAGFGNLRYCQWKIRFVIAFKRKCLIGFALIPAANQHKKDESGQRIDVANAFT